MEKLTKYLPISGDDDGIFSIPLRNVSDSYNFKSLEFPTTHPLTYAVKDKLVDFANKYYRNYDIVGYTIEDFSWNLQIDLMENLDTFEKMLAVYDDDIAKPTQSRTIKREYDITDDNEQSSDGSNSTTGSDSTTTKTYELPIDNGTSEETERTESTGSSDSTNTNKSSTTGKNRHYGTEIEDWSDVGVAPNYELLNGFLDNNRSLYREFVRYFENDFTLTEGYYGIN